ncbi:aldo/keto reductase [Candidatus Bathyarchaeota archaeon]|nr:aldo/keto reductase [Candidatus Bathyarchaeota archaeon]MBS7628238.1 aldo/keto reductase [Candidatus Bathyarchaeota archaeon]
MKTTFLGKTGIRVSRLSIGTDYRHVYGKPEVGSLILRKGLELGINFWDTADDYGAHPSIKEALRHIERSEVVIATKTYGSKAEDVLESLNRSMREMETNYFDIYMLHAIDDLDDIKRRLAALEAILDAKKKGLIRSVGLSTHSPWVAKAVLNFPEIEVVLAVVNKDGLRIRDGTLGDMLQALRLLYEAGKGVYIMKTLGRGILSKGLRDALDYVLKIPYAHSVTVGITRIEELEEDVRIAQEVLGEEP